MADEWAKEYDEPIDEKFVLLAEAVKKTGKPLVLINYDSEQTYYAFNRGTDTHWSEHGKSCKQITAGLTAGCADMICLMLSLNKYRRWLAGREDTLEMRNQYAQELKDAAEQEWYAAKERQKTAADDDGLSA